MKSLLQYAKMFLQDKRNIQVQTLPYDVGLYKLLIKLMQKYLDAILFVYSILKH